MRIFPEFLSKMWISNSDHGGLFFVFAQTENSDPNIPNYKNIKCFILERNTSGFEISPPENKLGLKSSATCALHFDNCIVPNENVIPHPGYKIAIEALNVGRIAIGAQMVGIAQGALNETWPIINDRKQFGKHLYEFQSVRHDFSRLRAETLAIESLVDKASALYEQDKPYLVEASSAKYLAGNLAQKVTSKCIDLAGGIGFTEDL